MTQSNWTDKDENGDYVHFLIRHEIVDHGKTEEQAVAILTKYFGPEPTKWDELDKLIGKHPNE